MSEWWTYRPSDFLLFSSQTYYRLFELYNIDIWPLQISTLVLGFVIPALIWRNPPWQGRVISVALAACWLWVAWAYHLQRYATINWAASYFAAAFAIEAILLTWIGVIRGKLVYRRAPSVRTRAGLGIYLFALVAQPCIAPIAGRPWVQAEVFGITPDPTVVATLGVLLLTVCKSNWILLVIPILWCAVSGAILGTMKSPDALLMPLVALGVILLALWNTFWRSQRSVSK